ncbi:MAG: hypothetical protein JO069_01035 [Verrucomicrobia bacterium]|nr:hypothetical protein [Verrucomicrobiota bacterium]
MRDAAYDRYLDGFARLAGSGRFKNDQEARLMYRLLGCAALDHPFVESIEHFWRMFLQFWSAGDPLKPKITSLVLEQVGGYYAQREGSLPFSFGEEGEFLRDEDAAIGFLEESIKSDPSNLGAYLKLLDVYESAEKTSDRNRLLDRITRLFPNEKAVLLRAGRECVKRKAYSKGIQYLERARSLDPLDPEVLETLVLAYTNLARQCYEKKNVDKGRQAFNLARPHATRDQTDFIRGLDFLQALQAVLEMSFADNETGLRLMATARECTHSLAALLLFAHGHFRLYRRQRGSPVWTELLQNRTQVASPPARKGVFLAFKYVYSLHKTLDWSAEIAFIRECLAPVAGEAFTRDEAWAVLTSILPFPQLAPLAQAIVAEALRRNPNDARFRFYSVMSRCRSPADLDLAEADEIYRDAMRQGDTPIAELVKAAMEDARDALAPPFGGDLGPPRAQLEEMRRAAAEMSDAEFAQFRRESAKFIPLPVFDMFMADVREKPSRPPRPTT